MDGTEVNIKIICGYLKGKKKTNIDGFEYFSFKHIPYAKSPLGFMRFKAPIPLDNWSGFMDCTKDDINESLEDCLYINVFTPKIPNTCNLNLMPVMVFIPGYSPISNFNNPDIYGPDYLIRENIVLVIVSYRRGTLGFFQLVDESLQVEGNAGLKDILLALKWIQKNILYFSGNKENVTIFGQGFGAACVHLLLLSPLCKGLFHKAIMQSGTALNEWAFGQKGAVEYSKLLGFENKSEQSLLVFCRGLPIKKITEIESAYCKKNTKGDLTPLMGPTIEKNTFGRTFLNDTPENIMNSKEFKIDVPIMMGYNSNEGLIFKFFEDNININDFSSVMPGNLLKKQNNFVKTVKSFYEKKDNEGNICTDSEQFFNMMGDWKYLLDIHKSLKYLKSKTTNEIYFYKFNMDSELNLFKNFINILDIPGACHGDELGYLFHTPYSSVITKNTSKLYENIKRVTNYWTNFAKTGNPSNEKLFIWKPLTENEFYYTNIGLTITLNTEPDKEKIQFWNTILQN